MYLIYINLPHSLIWNIPKDPFFNNLLDKVLPKTIGRQNVNYVHLDTVFLSETTSARDAKTTSDIPPDDLKLVRTIIILPDN